MILKLLPACKDYLWGGEKLRENYHVNSALHPLAEAWVLSCHPDGPSMIAPRDSLSPGPYAGKTLPEFLAQEGDACLGSHCAGFAQFPVLTKLIDARDNLSIQVHPSDEYAQKHEGQFGKTEMWYIVDCEPGAFLYYGFEHEISREEFAQRIQENTLTQVLHAAPVHPGDCFFIPAGTLHAIGKGIIIAEIQQNSNVTYRVYDYGRLGADGKPRALHVQKALEVTELSPAKTDWDFGGHLAQCRYFTVDLFHGTFSDTVGSESFVSLLVVEGSGQLFCGDESVLARQGDSFFLPAGSGTYRMQGDFTVLRTFV